MTRPYATTAVIVLLALAGAGLVSWDVLRRERRIESLADSLADSLDTRQVKLRCLSSWYAWPEHGRPTASGEIFDSTALTCAIYRPYLRLAGGWGARLLVRCTYNRRTVVVRITDAMPSHYALTGRMLDLSKAAAESLGMVNTGVFPVECWLVYRPRPTSPTLPPASRD